jgi:hypothetical protein
VDLSRACAGGRGAMASVDLSSERWWPSQKGEICGVDLCDLPFLVVMGDDVLFFLCMQ